MPRLATLFAIGTLLAVACSTYGEEDVPTSPPERDGGVGGGEDAPATSDACVDCPAPVVPDGWSLVVVASSCPAEFSDAREYVKNPRAPMTDDACTCSCGAPTSNGCTQGTATVSVRTGPTTCNDGQFSADCDGACHALAIGATGWNGASLPARAPVAVTCTETTKAPALVDDGHVSVCRSTKAGTLPPIGTTACVVRSGEEACPSGWPTRSVLVAPNGITDGRTCATCNCAAAPAACAAPTLTLYTDAACVGAGTAINANNVCNGVILAGTPSHYRYTAQSTATCAPEKGKSAISGTVQLTAPETMCCR